eukprot:396927-Rhodomonas_salina.1
MREQPRARGTKLRYWARCTGTELRGGPCRAQVITPNVYNLKLWEISGHAAHYKENMFIFNVEGQ